VLFRSTISNDIVAKKPKISSTANMKITKCLETPNPSEISVSPSFESFPENKKKRLALKTKENFSDAFQSLFDGPDNDENVMNDFKLFLNYHNIRTETTDILEAYEQSSNETLEMLDREKLSSQDLIRHSVKAYATVSVGVQAKLSLETRKPWKIINELNRIKIQISHTMPQKWIRKVWKLIKKTPQQLEEELVEKPTGWVYILFNSVTKRIYVGETERKPIDRYAEHIRAAIGRKEARKSYNYMRRIMLGSWTIIPVEHASSKDELERKERVWKHLFRNNIINDPTIWQLKPTLKKKKRNGGIKPQRKSQQERIEARKLLVRPSSSCFPAN